MPWLDRCDVSAISGDIFSKGTEGVVVPVECALNFTHDLGHQMQQRFGFPAVQRAREALDSSHGGKLRLGNSISVEIRADGLPHNAILVAWWAESNRYDRCHVEQCVTSSLREAFRLGLRSVAMPLFGSGSVDLRKEDLYSGIVQALADLDSLRTSDAFPVVELVFVSLRSEDILALDRRLDELLQSR